MTKKYSSHQLDRRGSYPSLLRMASSEKDAGPEGDAAAAAPDRACLDRWFEKKRTIDLPSRVSPVILRRVYVEGSDFLKRNAMKKIGYRPYVDVDTIVPTNEKPVGTGSCAALVQHYTRVGKTSNWKEGIPVRGNGGRIKKGTAIATFENGEYPNKETGNHAAFYISQDAEGIKVVEQFKSQSPQERHLAFKGKDPDGSFEDPSNNGDAFSVIELKVTN